MCPSDNESTILLIIDEPRHEEYLVSNETDSDISYAKFDQGAKKRFHDPIVIPSKEKSPFVWNYRENLIKRIEILAEDESKTVPLNKCTEGD
jgi:hypothetical protein